MKKMALGILLTLGAVGLTASPALSGPAPSDADRAFLATLAVPETAPAPEAAAKRPGGAEKAGCSGFAQCGSTPLTCTSAVNGASCTGTDQNCAAGIRGSVTCNGLTTQCPACPSNCTQLSQQCQDNCGSCPVRVFRCSPYTCSCDTSQGPCT